jgi:hypothetical protein
LILPALQYLLDSELVLPVHDHSLALQYNKEIL